MTDLNSENRASWKRRDESRGVADRDLTSHERKKSRNHVSPKKREAAISTLNNFRSSIIDLAQVFHHEAGGGPDYEHGEDDIPEDESVERRPRVDAIRELWKTEATNLERELNTEISLIWRRVRQLERIAIGPDQTPFRRGRYPK